MELVIGFVYCYECQVVVDYEKYGWQVVEDFFCYCDLFEVGVLLVFYFVMCGNVVCYEYVEIGGQLFCCQCQYLVVFDLCFVFVVFVLYGGDVFGNLFVV